MRINKFALRVFTLSLFAAFLLTSCGGNVATEVPVTDVPVIESPTATATPVVDPTVELYEAAKAEGKLSVIALPFDWCSYGEIIEAFKSRYPGIEINELNPDAGSDDQIKAIKDGGAQSPDVIDIGFSFGEPNKDLFAPYKVSTWDTIPDGIKSADGYWYGDYYNVIGFLVNTDVQPDVPGDWSKLLDPKYKGQVALSGDPRTSHQAVQTVQAAALAAGGSLDDAAPGLRFFAELNRIGNLVPLIANDGLVAVGDTPVRLTWDYNALVAIDSFAGVPKAEFVVPKNGQFATVYIQAISASASHPNAAKLWMEFLYSDEAQLLYMEGYCHPAREAGLRARGVIPTELQTKLPEVPGVVFPTAAQLTSAKTLITSQWDAVVGLDIRK